MASAQITAYLVDDAVDEQSSDDHDWECEFCEKGYATESECEIHEEDCTKRMPAACAVETVVNAGKEGKEWPTDALGHFSPIHN